MNALDDLVLSWQQVELVLRNMLPAETEAYLLRIGRCTGVQA